jgi:hypothetical protein
VIASVDAITNILNNVRGPAQADSTGWSRNNQP